MTAGCGSPEYALRWKRLATPLGPSISQRRASGRRTSDIGSSGPPLSGWPTPLANDSNGSVEGHLAMKKRMGERDGSGANRTAITSLQVMAQLAGWATPSALDHKDQLLHSWEARQRRKADEGISLQKSLKIMSLWASGTTTPLSPAKTGPPEGYRLALNPAFSLWLMGFPYRWKKCGDRAMRALTRSRKRKRAG